MSEVENHYAGTRVGGGRPSSSHEPAGSGVRSAVDRVSRAASETRGKVSDLYDQASERSRSGYESASRRAVDLSRRSAATFQGGRRTVESFVEENPVMIGVAGLAAGLLIGALLPSTRRENEYFGRYADEVKDQGLRYAQDVVEQGRHLVEENLKGFAPGKVDRDTGDETGI